MTSDTSIAIDAPGRGAALRSRLADARLYLCIDARRQFDNSARSEGFDGGYPALQRDVESALHGSVDIVQLRDKNSPGAKRSGPLEAGEELKAIEAIRELCAEHGALVAVNDRADIAAAAGADILHLGQRDLSVEQARRIVGPDVLIGLSCHSEADVDAALQNPEVDYFCTGPVYATPTKPGRAAVGTELVAYASSVTNPDGPGSKPWFAIGGIDAANLAEVTEAGARRVVVVRAITDADEPTAAARELRDALD